VSLRDELGAIPPARMPIWDASSRALEDSPVPSIFRSSVRH
jgi:hypothetical protein